MTTKENGFFPFSTLELDEIKKKMHGNPDEIYASRYEVGRLLATIEWLQDREANIATRLGNSHVELDALFSPSQIDELGGVLEGEPTEFDFSLEEMAA